MFMNERQHTFGLQAAPTVKCNTLTRTVKDTTTLESMDRARDVLVLDFLRFIENANKHMPKHTVTANTGEAKWLCCNKNARFGAGALVDCRGTPVKLDLDIDFTSIY
jgi:hypothetical protein